MLIVDRLMLLSDSLKVSVKRKQRGKKFSKCILSLKSKTLATTPMSRTSIHRLQDDLIHIRYASTCVQREASNIYMMQVIRPNNITADAQDYRSARLTNARRKAMFCAKLNRLELNQ